MKRRGVISDAQTPEISMGANSEQQVLLGIWQGYLSGILKWTGSTNKDRKNNGNSQLQLVSAVTQLCFHLKISAGG